MGGPFHIASVSHSWDKNLPGHLNDDDFSLRGGGTVVIPEIKLKHQPSTRIDKTLNHPPASPIDTEQVGVISIGKVISAQRMKWGDWEGLAQGQGVNSRPIEPECCR